MVVSALAGPETQEHEMTATQTTATRNNWKGHDHAAVLYFHGTGTEPTAKGQLVRVETFGKTLQVLSFSGGETLAQFGAAGKFWAVPAIRVTEVRHMSDGDSIAEFYVTPAEHAEREDAAQAEAEDGDWRKGDDADLIASKADDGDFTPETTRPAQSARFVVATTRVNNEPEVHSAWCKDTANRAKYDRVLNPGSSGSTPDDAAEWFWSDFIDSGELTPEDARAYTKYLPCTKGEGPAAVTQPVKGSPCKCGCGAIVKGLYKQGHDAKHVSQLVALFVQDPEQDFEDFAAAHLPHSQNLELKLNGALARKLGWMK
jgi:hypothetical protein